MTRFRHNLRAIFLMGLPLAGSHLAQMSIGITDTVMLGWYGVGELAAQSLASSFFFVIYLLGSGFGIAVMPMVAAAISNGDRRQVRRVTRMGLWISAFAGLLAMPLFWFSGPIFLALGQTEAIAGLMQQYLRTAGWSLPFFLVAVVFKSYLAALGHTQITMWATLAGTVINVLLNWVLIFGHLGAPELGILGAAIASLGTNALIMVLLAAYAVGVRDLRGDTILARIWRPDWDAFREVFVLGLPIGLTMLAEAGLFTASGIMMGWISEEALAVHGIAVTISGATFMIHLGLSSAATVRAGYAWGAKDIAELRSGAFAALSLSLIMVVLTVAAFLGMPDLLMGLFLDPATPDRDRLIAMGRALLATAALFQLADAMQVMAVSLLRGVQDTRRPMLYAVVSYWGIGVPMMYLLGVTLDLGGVGVWLGMAAGLTAAGISMMARFWRGPARSPLAFVPDVPAPKPTGAGR
ncbi:MATE family efflux transporter [Rhodobacteraceae bacterium W635]|uniref:MATE family efflux transporter n=1 Tax=Nioella halotolerans TaxID=2303578 RepID=UPI000E3D3D0E|nr:MATE family efflux transporter [Rhodobacteraceae bacterium W635]